MAHTVAGLVYLLYALLECTVASRLLHPQRREGDMASGLSSMPKALLAQMQSRPFSGEHESHDADEEQDDIVGMRHQMGHGSDSAEIDELHNGSKSMEGLEQNEHHKDHHRMAASHAHDASTQTEPPVPAEKQSPLDNIARNEAIWDMHRTADVMKSAAKSAHDQAHKQNDEAKEDTGVTSVSSTMVPKDSAGNIIITNKTHGDKKDPSQEVDPIKALTIATLNLYQRARNKGLPVGDAGELQTPEQIYQALNQLEYVIDGFRRSQLESPNPDLNIAEETQGDTNADQIEPEELRFLQTGTNAKHKHLDDETDAEDNDNEEENEEENEDEQENEDNKEDEEEEDGDHDESQDEAPTKQPKMSKQEALHTLESTVTELLEVLNKVVAANTGIDNVLVHHKGEPQQIK